MLRPYRPYVRLEVGIGGDVIDVAVRIDDVGEGQPFLVEVAEDALAAKRGIDDCRLLSLGIPEQVSIDGKGSHLKPLNLQSFLPQCSVIGRMMMHFSTGGADRKGREWGSGATQGLCVLGGIVPWRAPPGPERARPTKRSPAKHARAQAA